MVGLPTEKAVLVIDGQNYEDWESVMVRHDHMDPPFFSFRFTCSEGMPLAQNFAKMRIVPGSKCQVYLAGLLAFSGYVSTRQVYYDAMRHYIEIRGSSPDLGLSMTSVVSKTMEWPNTTFMQFAQSILAPTGVKLSVLGGALPDQKFPRISVAHGTPILEAIQTHLRQLGSFPLTSNINGDLVIAVGPSGGGSTVTEGKDILEGRETIFSAGLENYGSVPAIGSAPGTDDKRGAQVSHVPFAEMAFQSFGAGKLPITIINELPAWTKNLLQNRASATRDWQHKDSVILTITVYGWLKPSGGLWERNEVVNVISPMLVMSGGEGFKTKSVTFMQDNAIGTRTILDIRNEIGMGGQIPAAPGSGP